MIPFTIGVKLILPGNTWKKLCRSRDRSPDGNQVEWESAAHPCGECQVKVGSIKDRAAPNDSSSQWVQKSNYSSLFTTLKTAPAAVPGTDTLRNTQIWGKHLQTERV